MIIIIVIVIIIIIFVCLNDWFKEEFLTHFTCQCNSFLFCALVLGVFHLLFSVWTFHGSYCNFLKRWKNVSKEVRSGRTTYILFFPPIKCNQIVQKKNRYINTVGWHFEILLRKSFKIVRCLNLAFWARQGVLNRDSCTQISKSLVVMHPEEGNIQKVY